MSRNPTASASSSPTFPLAYPPQRTHFGHRVVSFIAVNILVLFMSALCRPRRLDTLQERFPLTHSYVLLLSSASRTTSQNSQFPRHHFNTWYRTFRAIEAEPRIPSAIIKSSALNRLGPFISARQA